MARGYPDYGIATGGYGQLVLDVAELSARSGGKSRYDRQGRVFFIETFENGLNNWNVIPGAGGEINVSTKYPFDNSLACRIIPPNIPGDSGIISKNFPLISETIHGLEFLFMFEGQFGVDSGVITLLYYYTDGTQRYLYSVEIDPNNETVAIQTDTGGAGIWVTVIDGTGQLDEAPDTRKYNYFKVTFDLVNLRYGRVLLNSLGANIGAYAPGFYDLSTIPSTLLQLSYTEITGAIPLDVTNIILTHSEPL
jgi:hypothetical protein